jgi:hypothetical protein
MAAWLGCADVSIATVAQGSNMQGRHAPLVRAALSLLLALGVISTTTAQADNGISTTVSGYGTVGGTFTSDGNYAYTHDPSEFTGATHQFDLGLESRIGVQAVVDFGSGFSVTAQELARQRGSDQFSLGTEWLFLQYSPDSDWKLRLGRVALPTFLMSDSREVGYAAPWFRAPNEIYGSESFQYIDGGQVLWHHTLGPVGLGLKGSYGNMTESYLELDTVDSVKVRSGYNVVASLEYGDFLFRVAQTVLTIPTVIPLSATYLLDFTVKDTFNSAGLEYDNGTAIVLSEFGKRTEPNIPVIGLPAAASKEWYVAGGWRFGKFTPLLIYGKYEPSPSLTEPGGNYGTWSASLRYDLVRNVALKAQVSRAQAANPVYWTEANPTSTERVNVFSLGADFVF